MKGQLEGFDDSHVVPDRGEQDLHSLNEPPQGVGHDLAEVDDDVLNHLEDGDRNNYIERFIFAARSDIPY